MGNLEDSGSHQEQGTWCYSRRKGGCGESLSSPSLVLGRGKQDQPVDSGAFDGLAFLPHRPWFQNSPQEGVGGTQGPLSAHTPRQPATLPVMLERIVSSGTWNAQPQCWEQAVNCSFSSPLLWKGLKGIGQGPNKAKTGLLNAGDRKKGGDSDL
jgi:hypothetical protein